MLLIFGLVRFIAKPSLIKVSRVSLHCSDMLNSKFYLVPCFTLFAVISGDVMSKMKAKFVSNSRSALRSIWEMIDDS